MALLGLNACELEKVEISSSEVPQKVESKKKRHESWYRDHWVKKHGGEAEVTLPDGSRCDILTATHAIEVDWAPKWAEAVGQSLWYSFQTNKQPGIVLIVRTDNDQKHLLRLRSLVEHQKLNIRVWVMDGASSQSKTD